MSVMKWLALAAIIAGAFAAGLQVSRQKAAIASRIGGAQNPASSGKDGVSDLKSSVELKRALGEVFAKHAGGDRLLAFVELLNRTPVSQLGELIGQLQFCPYPDERAEFLKLAYAKWTLAEPQAALANAEAASLHAGKLDPLPLVFETWAGTNPQAALAAARQLANLVYRTKEINAVLDIWVTSNQMAALAALKALHTGQGD